MNQKTFKRQAMHYLYGGVIALLLTTAVFILAMTKTMNGTLATAVFLGFALCQFIAQLYFFLHLSDEKKPYLKNVTLLFTTLMVLILVAGSIWVMWHLNYNMEMSPEKMNNYMLEQNKKGF